VDSEQFAKAPSMLEYLVEEMPTRASRLYLLKYFRLNLNSSESVETRMNNELSSIV
jgi:hypothetical protein